MSKGDILVKEAMKVNPISIQYNSSVQKAAMLMTKEKHGHCIVMQNKPIGIITESDILQKIVSKGKDSSKVKVNEIMNSPLIVIDPYITVHEAMKIMARCNIRRLPVIENDELIGVITERDIVRISPLLNEISKEWHDINKRDETYYKRQSFSGKCEDCNILSTGLKNIDGKLLCEDCIDALNYE